MILIRSCWYLCVLFFVMLVFSSSITVHPDNERGMGISMLMLLISGVVSGGGAILLYRMFQKNPDGILFKSKIAVRSVVGIAVVLTLFFVFGVVG